jgi:hypothetical protein
MIPGKFDIKIYRGSTFEHTLYAAIADIDVDFGVDYTSAELHVRPAWVSTGSTLPPLLTLSTENGGITITGLLVKLNLSAVETAALQFVDGKYDLEFINANVTPAVVDKLLYGSVTVFGEKTI